MSLCLSCCGLESKFGSLESEAYIRLSSCKFETPLNSLSLLSLEFKRPNKARNQIASTSSRRRIRIQSSEQASKIGKKNGNYYEASEFYEERTLDDLDEELPSKWELFVKAIYPNFFHQLNRWTKIWESLQKNS
ncbi:hypothetical protein CKAN_00525200 [Cinnamomum micranthum f. kanehirae]|uniref:Uncharacterized protein n=1 Tax=Cinnamomum micranthum f. kanehirae TaxID=337451 RepID=A0A443NE45_9MAGN|nr:hypothetical protein CKAN_00525200 [Cinnamomum micranthum f. kanehirae]